MKPQAHFFRYVCKTFYSKMTLPAIPSKFHTHFLEVFFRQFLVFLLVHIYHLSKWHQEIWRFLNREPMNSHIRATPSLQILFYYLERDCPTHFSSSHFFLPHFSSSSVSLIFLSSFFGLIPFYPYFLLSHSLFFFPSNSHSLFLFPSSFSYIFLSPFSFLTLFSS